VLRSFSHRYWTTFGILVFVHQNVAKPLAVLRKDVGMSAKDRERVEQQIAEISGVQRFQPFLVLAIELTSLAKANA